MFSVNNKTGTIVLAATDVGAIATGGSISMAQVTGLSAALSAAIPQSRSPASRRHWEPRLI